MKTLIAFSLLLLFSCQNNSTNQSIASKAVEKDTLAQSQKAMEYCSQYDVVHGDSIKIDGKVRIIDSKKAMLALFGKQTRSEKI